MSINYTYEKLGAGIGILATHADGIQDRLRAAFGDSLHMVSPKGMPKEAEERWADVMAKVNAVEGKFETLSDKEASELAQQIRTIHALVAEHLRSGRPGLYK